MNEMAKKEEVEQIDNEVTETEQVEQVSNIVHGLDFGARTKLKVVRDGKVLNFLFVNGESLTLDTATLDSGLLDEAALYGLEYKVKASLASKASVDECFAEVTKQVDGFVKGTFFLRSMGGEVAGLSIELEAFAKVKAAQEGYGHWVNTDDAGVIGEVLEYWKGLERKVKNSILKHSTVLAMLLQLKLERGIVDSVDF